jgi:hypothetical protein
VRYLWQCTELLLSEQLAGVVILCCRNMRDVTPCRLASKFCPDCSTLKKKAIWSPETSGYACPKTRRNISEELNLQQRSCVDLRNKRLVTFSFYSFYPKPYLLNISHFAAFGNTVFSCSVRLLCTARGRHVLGCYVTSFKMALKLTTKLEMFRDFLCHSLISINQFIHLPVNYMCHDT